MKKKTQDFYSKAKIFLRTKAKALGFITNAKTKIYVFVLEGTQGQGHLARTTRLGLTILKSYKSYQLMWFLVILI